VPVHHDDYAGQIHGFFEMFTVFPDSHHAVGVAGEALSQAFSHSAKEFSCDR
jgi:acetyl esterase